VGQNNLGKLAFNEIVTVGGDFSVPPAQILACRITARGSSWDNTARESEFNQDYLWAMDPSLTLASLRTLRL